MRQRRRRDEPSQDGDGDETETETRRDKMVTRQRRIRDSPRVVDTRVNLAVERALVGAHGVTRRSRLPELARVDGPVGRLQPEGERVE